jgi:hypothetical protein
MPGEVREEVADPVAAFAVLGEFPGGGEEVAGGGELDAGLFEGEGLAVVASQKRLGIERIDVRGAALHEEEDDATGAGGEVRRFGGEGIGGRRGARFVAEQ